MDFEPYSEVVLPPDKGTGIRRRKKGAPSAKQSLPAPKEYKRSADVIPVETVTPDEVLAQGKRDKVIPTSERRDEDTDEQPIILDPTDDTPIQGSERPVESPVSSAESGVSPAPAESGVAADERRSELVDRQGTTTPPPATAAAKSKASRSSTNGPKDFIVSYDGRFIGHFHSERRIGNRKVFEKAARRLQEGFDEFDIRLLEIYKPVKLKVDVPEDVSKIAEGTFHWF